jgi:hypothetical protein
VRLECRGGEVAAGRSGNGLTNAEELRHAGEATLEALRQLVGPDTRLELQGVASAAALGRSVIVAAVKVSNAQETRTLMGICPSSLHLPRDAALAVLDATNRFLGLG